MKLNSILEKVIRKSGGLKPPKLGSEIETRATNFEMLSITSEDKQQLLDYLREQSRFNNKVIITIIISYFIFHALVIFVVLYNRDSPAIISALLGGSLLPLLGVIASMRNLLKEKHIMDLMRVTIPNLSSEEAMKFIQSVYHQEKKDS